jgi:A/G-specific adenine glycosylase
MRTQPRPASSWVQALLAWYRENRRDLPWRRNRDPYCVWISEIMLQQTQVETVIPYYRRFLKRFPTLRTLARAPLDDVLKQWEGLGYYARARNLHAAARVLADRPGTPFPTCAADWLELPGFGPYTSAAVASICFNEAVPVVDGNVARVFARFLALDTDIAKPATRETIRACLHRHIPVSAPGDFNQAIMELGALICRPLNPACPQCPIRTGCRALRTSTVSDYPVKRTRARVTRQTLAVGLFRTPTHILLVRRHEHGMLGGLWDLPSQPAKPPSSTRATVERLARQLVGRDPERALSRGTVGYRYTHLDVQARVWECTWKRWTSPRAGDTRALRFDSLGNYALTGLARKILSLRAASFTR